MPEKGTERLMMEHNRGWRFCCLIAHDTFGSFMTAQCVELEYQDRHEDGVYGFRFSTAFGSLTGDVAWFRYNLTR